MHCPPIGGSSVYSVDVWDGGWASTVLGVDPQHCRCSGRGPSVFSVGGWPPTQRGLHTMPSWTEKSKTNEVSSLAPGSETKKGYKYQNLIYICFSNRPFGLRPWRRTGSLHLSLTFGLSCSPIWSLFSANFWRQYLGNGLSDLLETFTDFDQHAWSKSVKVSSKSGKPFLIYFEKRGFFWITL